MGPLKHLLEEMASLFRQELSLGPSRFQRSSRSEALLLIAG